MRHPCRALAQVASSGAKLVAPADVPAGATGAGRGSVHAMDARRIATVHAGGRVVVGAALTVAPRAATAGWIGGKDAERAPVTVVARALGVRDAVMGLGVLRTLGDAEAAKPWMAACLVADAVDLGATLMARDQLPRQGAVAVSMVAAGSVLLGGWLLSALG